MSGIYIHIPFCKKVCYYCDFHFSVSLRNIEDTVKCIISEIELRRDYLKDAKVKSVYFGGGTPSVLDVSSVEQILSEVHRHHAVENNAEVTFEANPDDIDSEYLASLKNAGINRLSLGVQSFFDEDLIWLNRRHNGNDSYRSIVRCMEAGFENVNIDLLYGIPGMDGRRWLENLKKALSLPVKHLSAYLLTIEPKTVFGHYYKKGKIKEIDDDTAIEHFNILKGYLVDKGFIHYEISNFALPGFFSRHNCSYWSMEEYLGVGPSASSYNGYSRQWNIWNNSLYVDEIKSGRLPFEKEILSLREQYNEYILTSLRTMWGADLKFIRDFFGETYEKYCLLMARNFIENGQLKKEEEKLKLTDIGQQLTDYITCSLFAA